MNVFNLSASRLGFVKRESSGSWTSGKAYQGQYGGNAGSRVGAIIFDGLRNVDWSAQTISQIVFTFAFSTAGTSKPKDIRLYSGTRDTLGGTGTAMLGSLLGTFSTIQDARNSTVSVTLTNSGDTATVFSNIVSFLQTGTTNTFAIYNGETTSSSSGWTSNYLCITSCSIRITYEISGSSGTVTPSTVQMGTNATLAITPITVRDGQVLQHKVKWLCGTKSSAETTHAASETTIVYTIPTSWASEVQTGISRDAECVITTYVDGTARGTRNIPFTVTLPADYAPTFSSSIRATGRSSDYSTYYQFADSATITLSSVSAASGATIASYTITGTEGVSGSTSDFVISGDTATYTTPKFKSTGTHSYTVKVTDSRGMSTSQTITISSSSVIEVAAPTITAFSVARYASRINDQGIIEYYESIIGGHVWITYNASGDRANGRNPLSAYILYGAVESTSAKTRVNLTWPSTDSSISTSQDRTIITVDISLDDAYEFELHVIDSGRDVFTRSRVEKGEPPAIHVAGTGYGLGLGMYSSGTKTDPKIQVGWPIYADSPVYANAGLYGEDGTRVDVAEVYSQDTISTLSSNFAPYATDVYPVVVRSGRIVQLNGICTPTGTLTSSSSAAYLMFTLPSEYRPTSPVRTLCQGSTTCMWLLMIDTDGSVSATRYRSGANYTDFSAGTWLPFHVTWIV